MKSGAKMPLSLHTCKSLLIPLTVFSSKSSVAKCLKTLGRRWKNSLWYSGPFFLLFWITSLARYRKVSFFDGETEIMNKISNYNRHYDKTHSGINNKT